jgi:hypothetical protein
LTDHFEVNRKLKQGDGLFNIALEHAIRQLSVDANYIYNSGQIIRYADDINIMGRSTQTV